MTISTINDRTLVLAPGVDIDFEITVPSAGPASFTRQGSVPGVIPVASKHLDIQFRIYKRGSLEVLFIAHSVIDDNFTSPNVVHVIHVPAAEVAALVPLSKIVPLSWDVITDCQGTQIACGDIEGATQELNHWFVPQPCYSGTPGCGCGG